MSNLGDFLEADEFDNVAADSGRPDPIPVGEYTLEMVSYETKNTKDNTGLMFNAVFKVADGEYEGRSIFTNFNIRNKNDQAQKIGRAQLKALTEAIGIPAEVFREDTSAALRVPFSAKVGLGKTTPDYPEARNEIKTYHPAGDSAPASKPAAVGAKPAPVPASKPAAVAPTKMAWNKRPAAQAA